MGDKAADDMEDKPETVLMMSNQDEKKKQMMITVRRPVYTQEAFDEVMPPMPKHSKTLKERFSDLCSKCQCSTKCMGKAASEIFPFVSILKGYSVKDDFMNDIISGLTVGIMHIPQGMAYGMLANLPPVYGLYISFFPVLVYFIFGHSRQVSMGTFAVVSLMVGVVVDKADCKPSSPPSSNATNQLPEWIDSTSIGYGMENSTALPTKGSGGGAMSEEELMCKVGVAMATNLMVGLYQLSMGLLRMGFVTIYMSEPLTRSFTTGAAIYVFTSQIKHIFGITTGKYNGMFKLIYTYRDFFLSITTTNVASLVMGCICIVIMYLTKEYLNPIVKAKIKMPVPIELIVIIFGTLASFLGQFEYRFDMIVVGEIPSGIPPPAVPPLNKLSEVAGDALGIAIVAFAVNISMGKLFAKKHNYELPANNELVAYGITNISSSFFNCYTSAASLSRSLVQESVGGKTQVAGLVSCSLLLVVLFGVGPLFEQLPNTVLAAIVIVNLKGMFLQFGDLKKLWYICTYDFLIWLVTFLAVCMMGADLGLLAGIVFALLTVVFRTQSPYTCILGRVPHTDIYRDMTVYENCQEIPGMKIFRFESSLYYANSEHFVDKLFQKCELNPRKLKAKQKKVEKKRQTLIKEEEKRAQKGAGHANIGEAAVGNGSLGVLDSKHPIPTAPIYSIIIDCLAMSYLDYVGVNTLCQVMEEYGAVGVEVTLAGCKAGVRDMFKAAGFFEKIPTNRLMPSVHDAVIMAIKVNQTLRQEIERRDRGNSFSSITELLHEASNDDDEDVVVPDGSPLLDGANGTSSTFKP